MWASGVVVDGDHDLRVPYAVEVLGRARGSRPRRRGGRDVLTRSADDGAPSPTSRSRRRPASSTRPPRPGPRPGPPRAVVRPRLEAAAHRDDPLGADDPDAVAGDRLGPLEPDVGSRPDLHRSMGGGGVDSAGAGASAPPNRPATGAVVASVSTTRPSRSDRSTRTVSPSYVIPSTPGTTTASSPAATAPSTARSTGWDLASTARGRRRTTPAAQARRPRPEVLRHVHPHHGIRTGRGGCLGQRPGTQGDDGHGPRAGGARRPSRRSSCRWSRDPASRGRADRAHSTPSIAPRPADGWSRPAAFRRSGRSHRRVPGSPGLGGDRAGTSSARPGEVGWSDACDGQHLPSCRGLLLGGDSRHRDDSRCAHAQRLLAFLDPARHDQTAVVPRNGGRSPARQANRADPPWFLRRRDGAPRHRSPPGLRRRCDGWRQPARWRWLRRPRGSGHPRPPRSARGPQAGPQLRSPSPMVSPTRQPSAAALDRSTDGDRRRVVVTGAMRAPRQSTEPSARTAASSGSLAHVWERRSSTQQPPRHRAGPRDGGATVSSTTWRAPGRHGGVVLRTTSSRGARLHTEHARRRRQALRAERHQVTAGVPRRHGRVPRTGRPVRGTSGLVEPVSQGFAHPYPGSGSHG